MENERKNKETDYIKR